MSHQTFILNISVNYARCEQLYRQGYATVVVPTVDGKRVQLPSKNLRPFVGPKGIHGRFLLVTDEKNKLVSLQKID
ncbi:DUF2835 family protein [Alteromonas oceanisediminis]|uniref:DUF2835 family protein n=1 Tax=Alteromonas oceanisediminis TaxID=2836180 RepID=UPI001BDAFF1B|nr:DUF2835 family protein [Alteromonas oceanisediminis]MBT0587120.1 DUF2835 family protein [Alteromonas oceanisediminis]